MPGTLEQLSAIAPLAGQAAPKELRLDMVWLERDYSAQHRLFSTDRPWLRALTGNSNLPGLIQFPPMEAAS
jgi:hypothetical protein